MPMKRYKLVWSKVLNTAKEWKKKENLLNIILKFCAPSGRQLSSSNSYCGTLGL